MQQCVTEREWRAEGPIYSLSHQALTTESEVKLISTGAVSGVVDHTAIELRFEAVF